MNWDISIGQYKQWFGRLLQVVGRRFGDRRWVAKGDRFESDGCLQSRYGVLKHRAEWGLAPARIPARNATPDTMRDRRDD